MISVHDDLALSLDDSISFFDSLASFGFGSFLQEFGILTDQGVAQNQQFSRCEPCIAIESTGNTSENFVNLLQDLQGTRFCDDRAQR